MKTETIILLALVAVVGYYLVTHPQALSGNAPVSEVDRLKSIIGNIPPDPRFLPKQDKLSLTQGIVSGGTTGLAFGPIGAGVGAGAGAVASFFV